jgi:hypothetical protein
MVLSGKPFAWVGFSLLVAASIAVALAPMSDDDPKLPKRNQQPSRTRTAAPKPAPVADLPTLPEVEDADEVLVIVNEHEHPYTMPHALTIPYPRAHNPQPVLYFGDVPSSHRTYDPALPHYVTSVTTSGAIQWLVDAQADDGSWPAPLATVDSLITETALAVIALRDHLRVHAAGVEATRRGRRGKPDSALKAVQDAVDKGARMLLSRIDGEGRFGTDRVAAHALALMALGTQSRDDALTRANLQLQEAALRTGWPARINGTNPDLLATVLAMRALGQSVPQPTVLSGLLMDKDSVPPPDLLGQPQEAWKEPLRLLLLEATKDPYWTGGRERASAMKTLAQLPTADGKNPPALALWWTLAGAGILDSTQLPRGWRAALVSVLRSSQVPPRHRDAATWTPQAPLGRVGTTALAVCLMLEQPEPAAQPTPTQPAKQDSDKDEAPDAPDGEVLPPVPTQGALFCCGEYQPDTPLPLQHTGVKAVISGIVASTQVTQTFRNGHEVPIEAVYCFPLPHLAAVTDFSMQIGTRTIRAVMRARADAERVYTQAIARGQIAAIMTRERGNIFNHYIGNIEPGVTVDVRVTYFERIVQQDQTFEWVFPMVVGPYFVAGTEKAEVPATDSRVKGHGVSSDTDRVPDASRVTPPILPAGFRSSHDISLEVVLDSGFEIADLSVVTHNIEIEVSGPSMRKIRLAGDDNIPNRDFILRWTLAESGPRHILLTHKPDKSAPGWFCMMLRPDYPQPTRGPCEVTFVMDISGSMTGKPIEMCKSVVRQALQNLRPDDTFNIVWFSGHNGQVFEAHRSADVDAVEEALRHLDGFKAGGGTKMKEGIQRAMQVRDAGGREQLFAFLTDGYVAEAPARGFI